MLSYDELVDGLEDAWVAAGLHEHALVESVQPDTHDRSYRAELFPEHGEPLTEETMPPWVEVTFAWSAAHQLRAEGRDVETEALNLVWTYMLMVPGALRDQADSALVRRFQKAVYSALRRFYPVEASEIGQVAVEVRRVYQSSSQQVHLAYLQLVSTNVTDMSDQWDDPDPLALRRMIRSETQLASAVLRALRDTFSTDRDGGNDGYRSVDTA